MIIARRSVCFLLAGACVTVGSAGPVAAEEALALRARRMLDVRSGEMLENVTVLIEGERIEAVNPGGVPAEARIVDLGDVTLLPGLMDMHTHLNYDLETNWVHRPVEETPELNALRGVPAARATLLAGFTTVRDLGASLGFADVALARAIEEGWVVGPRMIPAAHAISITGGHCEITGFAPGILELGPEGGVADGVPEVLKAVRYQIKHGAKVIKVCATAGVLSFEGPAGAPQFSMEELIAIVEEAERHGLKVAAHAHGTEGIKNGDPRGNPLDRSRLDAGSRGDSADEGARHVSGTDVVPVVPGVRPAAAAPREERVREVVRRRERPSGDRGRRQKSPSVPTPVCFRMATTAGSSPRTSTWG